MIQEAEKVVCKFLVEHGQKSSLRFLNQLYLDHSATGSVRMIFYMLIWNKGK